jgi:hypothetical protein
METFVEVESEEAVEVSRLFKNTRRNFPRSFSFFFLSFFLLFLSS